MGTLAILLVGQAMAVMDASILVVAAPSLRASLHASGAEVQLVVAMYTLTFGALVVTGARLGDVLGRRRAFLQGLAAFTLASLVGGLSPSPSVLIAARALQGVAAALMTPQVLSIIQAQFEGERRARAIGAYSMILAVGVAAGQILGGVILTAHLLSAAWRPALLVNVPVGICLLATARRALPAMEPGARRRLDLPGVTLLAAALLALIVPLTFGRDYGWPEWIWPCFVVCGAAAAAFALRERRLAAGDASPLLDVRLFTLPGVAAGVVAVLLVMGAYGGFLLSLTLHLQGALHFSPLHAGLIFAIYASGFATASLTWTRGRATVRSLLPVVGPLLMAVALFGVGVLARGGSWPLLATAPLLFAGGAGHACAFSPLANRLATAIQPAQVADLSGLILTASLIGQVMGVAAFTGIYLSSAAHGSGRALASATEAIAGALLLATACAIQVAGGYSPTASRRARATSESSPAGRGSRSM